MPLEKGYGRGTVSSNIQEMMASPRLQKFSAAKRRTIAVAAAMRAARKSAGKSMPSHLRRRSD